MTWIPISGEAWARIPETAKEARRARWALIVTRLQAEHYARYHGQRDARLIEWAQTRGVA